MFFERLDHHLEQIQSLNFRKFFRADEPKQAHKLCAVLRYSFLRIFCLQLDVRSFIGTGGF